MPFTKGDPNINTKGRPSGKKNKLSGNLREFLNEFLCDTQSEFKESFLRLEDRDRVKFYINMMQFAIPKMKSTDFNTNEFDDEKTVHIYIPDNGRQ